MSIWKASSVDETPEVELSHWRIFEARSPYWDGVTRHFIGYNITEGEGRVSSAITTFDLEKMQGITRSGRVYKLVGEPGWHTDAEFVWSRWCQINYVESQQDVTKEIVNESQPE